MELTLEEEELKILSDLGLSHNQARIYLTLLKLGVDSKAVSIFKFSGVARQDVYRILCELQKIGIVQKIITKPAKFHAVQPKIAVSILLERKTSALAALNSEAEIFAKWTSKKTFKDSEDLEKDAFMLISQKSGIIEKCREEIERSCLSVDSIAPSKEFLPWIEACYDAFYAAAEKGARIRWVIEKPRKNSDLRNIQKALTDLPAIHLRYCRISPVVKFGIYDDKKAILAIFDDGKFAKAPALWTNSRTTIELAKYYFESYWKKGVDAEPRKVYQTL